MLHRLTSPKTAPDPATIAPPRPKRSEPAHHQSRTPTPKAANDRAPLADSYILRRERSAPDIAEFCSAVVDAARPVSPRAGQATGRRLSLWYGRRFATPGLTGGYPRLRFKGMLAEAHRSGRIELASADLKDGRDLKSLEESKILYKNTVWHFVRVQD